MGTIRCRLLLCVFVACETIAAGAQKALQRPPAQAAVQALPALPHPTVDRIRSKGSVSCGVIKEEEDYTRTEDHGNRAAFDLDLCKAVAVAMLGPAARLVVRSFPDEPFALRMLRSGEVDLVATASLNATNMAHAVAFSPPVLLDSQSFLFPASDKVRSGTDLAGKRVCFLTGSAAEEGLHQFAASKGIAYTWYPFSEAGEMEAAFFTGNCDAVTGDMTQLANIRGIEPGRVAQFTILPASIREDPLGVAVWAGDPSFAAVTYWTVALLMDAERTGITQASISRSDADALPAEVRQMLGQRFGTALELGLRARWGAEVVTAVGNYGEIFERDLGPYSPVGLPRGANRLAGEGGVLYPVPLHD